MDVVAENGRIPASTRHIQSVLLVRIYYMNEQSAEIQIDGGQKVLNVIR